MRVVRWIVSFLIIGALLIAASTYLHYIPKKHTPFYKHYLGMIVYNKSGKPFTEQEWALKTNLIHESWVKLKKCLGSIDLAVESKLRHKAIIILPPARIKPFGNVTDAFTDLIFIFIRADRFDAYTLCHEWIHNYLSLSHKRFLGDRLHRDDLFKKCAPPDSQ